MEGKSQQDHIRFHYHKPGQIPPETLEQIRRLIIKGGGVGKAYIRENLQKSFIVAYAVDQDENVAGTVTLKHPKTEYRKKIERASGWDLSGYLERGYTAVEPEHRGRGISDTLIKGLNQRSIGQKVYTTIGMDNAAALRLTQKNGMRLAADFINWRTGRKIGLFVNQ
ncbi:MAG: GNAT family N-acetyltransferase [Pseudomonadota bacterium]